MIDSPSDSRMHEWARTVTISQGTGYFPMAAFKDIAPVTISATLTSSQLGARTLVIATTSAFAGGRPQVQVNSWSGSIPAASTQPDSRGVTRGTWRGNVRLFSRSFSLMNIIDVIFYRTNATPSTFVSS